MPHTLQLKGFSYEEKIINGCLNNDGTVCKNISYFGVRSLMNDSLSGRSETLAAFWAWVRLGTRVDSFMNILETNPLKYLQEYFTINYLFAGLPKCFRTETTFERFRVLMHPTVSVVAACKSKFGQNKKKPELSRILPRQLRTLLQIGHLNISLATHSADFALNLNYQKII